MSTKSIWINQNQLSQPGLVIQDHDYFRFPNYTISPDTNTIQKQIKHIEEAIEKADAPALYKLLTYQLQCTRVLDFQEAETSDDGIELKPASYQIKVRPLVEGLLLMNDLNAKEIVKKIADSDNHALGTAFIESLQHCALDLTELFDWDNAKKVASLSAINTLLSHGQYLQILNIDKGKVIPKFVPELKASLDTIQDNQFDSTNSIPSLRNLQHKLEFCKKLHEHDALFNQQREYFKLLTDISICVLGLCLFNFINFAMTGNFLFFNTTASQECVNEIDAKVRPFNRYI